MIPITRGWRLQSCITLKRGPSIAFAITRHEGSGAGTAAEDWNRDSGDTRPCASREWHAIDGIASPGKNPTALLMTPQHLSVCRATDHNYVVNMNLGRGEVLRAISYQKQIFFIDTTKKKLILQKISYLFVYI